MAKPKLTNEQRDTLLMWLAAEYDSGLIMIWFAERDWPSLNRSTLTHYRKQYGILIEDMRAKRRKSAVKSGLALKEERVARLQQHADELEAIKWVPDERGRLWNEKVWRETLDDIAKEMGHRKQAMDIRIIREEALRLADELGLDVAEVMAEAERIVSEQQEVAG